MSLSATWGAGVMGTASHVDANPVRTLPHPHGLLDIAQESPMRHLFDALIQPITDPTPRFRVFMVGSILLYVLLMIGG